MGRDRIENVPDLDVRRHVVDAEKGLDIVPSGRPRQIPLEGQKRRSLRKEDRKGRTGGVEERVLRVVAGVPAIRSTRPWALLGMAFGVGFGIRKMSMPQEYMKTRKVSSPSGLCL